MNTQSRFRRLTLLGKGGLVVAAVLVVTVLAMVVTYISDGWVAVSVAGFWVVPIAWMVLLLIGAIPITRGTVSLFAPGRTNTGDHLFQLSLVALLGGVVGGVVGFELYSHLRGELSHCSFSFLGPGPYPPICTTLWKLGPRLLPLGAASGAGLVWWGGLALLDRGHRQRKNLNDRTPSPVRPTHPPPQP